MLIYVRVKPKTWSDFLSKTHNKVRFSTGRQSNYPLFANVKLLLKPLLRINCRERRQQFLTFQMWFVSGSYNHPKGLQFLLCVENLFPSRHIYYVKSCCPFMVFFSSGCCDATAIVCLAATVALCRRYWSLRLSPVSLETNVALLLTSAHPKLWGQNFDVGFFLINRTQKVSRKCFPFVCGCLRCFRWKVLCSSVVFTFWLPAKDLENLCCVTSYKRFSKSSFTYILSHEQSYMTSERNSLGDVLHMRKQKNLQM